MSVSHEQKPPPIRRDLEFVPQYYRGQLCYVAKDPVSLKYYRLGEAEYMVLKCFQRGMSVDQTRREVERRTGAQITPNEVHKFVEQLKQSDLLKSRDMGDVRRLATQQGLRKRHKLRHLMSNYLFITIPVWDPDRLLDRLLPYFRFFLKPWFLAFWLCVTGWAFWIVADNFSVLVADAFSLLSGWNLLILSIVIFSVKLVHEMGHALTCKHFGGEVHAIGPAFLVFQPCMFTDTSDAWLLPSKWDRIKITAAGIAVEIMLASVAALVWVSSRPGMAKQVAYTTMVACSVGTILFNANPLLRFDGYYILSDLLEIPNLRMKTSQYLSYLFDRYILGIEKQPPQMQPGDVRLYVTYGLARFFYRFFILLMIGLFLYSLFPPLGVFMWVTSLYGVVLWPVWRHGRELALQYRFGTVRTRYLMIMSVVCAGAAGLWFVPVTYTVSAPCVVGPNRLDVVRARVGGVVEAVLVREGKKVRKGQLLVKMKNVQLVHLAARTRAEIEQVNARIRRALAEDAADYEMELRRKRKLAEQLEELQEQIRSLDVRAPSDGVVVGLHYQEKHALKPQHGFVEFPEADSEGSPDCIEGATVEAGRGLLGVADISSLRFEAFAYEHDISSLSRGLAMSCVLRGRPDRVMESQIGVIVPVDVKDIENVGITLADVGYIPVKPAADGTSTPLVTLYVVRGEAPARDAGLRPGQTGKARITYGSGPAGSFYFRRIVRAIRLRLQEL